jgi:hypothetical protein
MVDLQETPAVPPQDFGGDERTGYFLAGGLLIVLGWGLGLLVNLALHMAAPSGGVSVAGIWFGRSIGTYAMATAGFGLVTGLLGVGLVFVGRSTPKGHLVLPGVDY